MEGIADPDGDQHGGTGNESGPHERPDVARVLHIDGYQRHGRRIQLRGHHTRKLHLCCRQGNQSDDRSALTALRQLGDPGVRHELQMASPGLQPLEQAADPLGRIAPEAFGRDGSLDRRPAAQRPFV